MLGVATAFTISPMAALVLVITVVAVTYRVGANKLVAILMRGKEEGSSEGCCERVPVSRTLRSLDADACMVALARAQ